MQTSLLTLIFWGIVIESNASFIFYFLLNSILQSPGDVNQDFPKSKITCTGKVKRKGQVKHIQK
jgi:hypothetical protein